MLSPGSYSLLQSNITGILFPAFSPARMIQPFGGFWNFLITVVLAFIFIFFITSLLYSTLRKLTSGGEEKTGGVQFVIMTVGILSGVAVYFFLRTGLHSMRVDYFGNYFYFLTVKPGIEAFLADILLAAAVLGSVGSWIRIYQILIIPDITERFKRLVDVLPYLSIFLTLGMLVYLWFFYSNIFGFWWYFIFFFLVYGIIIFFSYKDFHKMLQMRLSRSYEFEEHLSLKVISLAVGIVLTTLVIIFNLNTLLKDSAYAYMFVPYGILLLEAIYITPGKLFRQLKRFPRYSSLSSRILFFTRYTRTFLVFWTVIFIIITFLLSTGIIFDPGFTNPKKNVKLCSENVRQLGEAMEQYMEQNNSYLPDSADWQNSEWLKKIRENRKLKFMPTCSCGGEYQYRKWRSIKGIPMFEIRCSGEVHKRAALPDFYPRYVRKKGLVAAPPQKKQRPAIVKPESNGEKKGEKSPQEKSPQTGEKLQKENIAPK